MLCYAFIEFWLIDFVHFSFCGYYNHFILQANDSEGNNDERFDQSIEVG
jgi:hypothetical protein